MSRGWPAGSGVARITGGNRTQTTEPPRWRITGRPSGSTETRSKRAGVGGLRRLKAGLIMLTQCIALDYGRRGVRANCVCPGWIRTVMADNEMNELAARRGTDREGAYALATRDVPARRAGAPEEAAEAIAWLASPASSYVNGAVLPVDGGGAIVDVASMAFGGEWTAWERGGAQDG